MPILSFPNELLLQIGRCLLQAPPSDCDCNCHQHHITPHLSAFSRVNHRLHALLADLLLATASPLHILFWAVANSRTDTAAVALARGADPNTAHNWQSHTTPIDLAISMHLHSADADSRALHLHMVAFLLDAGGTCPAGALARPTELGYLDLLTVCLPHLRDTTDSQPGARLRTLLEAAVRHDHVEITELLIAAGAVVNSTGAHNDIAYYPPLWKFYDTSIRVLQVLLDAGADAGWVDARGASVLQNMRKRSVETEVLEEKIALLVRYGAVDEPADWPAVEARGPGFRPRRVRRCCRSIDTAIQEGRGLLGGAAGQARDGEGVWVRVL